jgi:E3 Ubiquitin ligase
MENVAFVGLALIALGIAGIVYGLLMRKRASRVTSAPFVKTGEAAQKGTAAANAQGAISVEGNVSCTQPLLAPFSGKTCLYYEIKVTAEWKEGDKHKTRDVSQEKRAAQFAVDDGSGPVAVDVREGGDFEPEEVKAETRTTSLIGGIAGQDLMFGQFRVSTGMLSMGTKFRVQETILPAVPRLYVCGKVGSSHEITKPGWSKLLVTNKGREDYLAHALKTAKIALIAAGSMLAVGLACGGVWAAFGGPPKTAAATAPANGAATATAAPATHPKRK